MLLTFFFLFVICQFILREKEELALSEATAIIRCDKDVVLLKVMSFIWVK